MSKKIRSVEFVAVEETPRPSMKEHVSVPTVDENGIPSTAWYTAYSSLLANADENGRIDINHALRTLRLTPGMSFSEGTTSSDIFSGLEERGYIVDRTYDLVSGVESICLLKQYIPVVDHNNLVSISNPDHHDVLTRYWERQMGGG